MLLLLFSIIGVITCQNMPIGEFGYGPTTDEVYGPPDWNNNTEWEDCGRDKQSPININTSSLVDKDYPTLKITFDNPEGLVTGTLENNRYFPLFNIDKSQGTAVLSGGPLGATTYTLNQFHVHFGCENDRGSEHTLDGKHYAGQLHMVFIEGTDKFAVVALWLKASSTGNPILGNFANKLQDIIEFDTSTNVKESDGIRLMQLLPDNNNSSSNSTSNEDNKVAILADYFHYEGSLTTPPCYETVMWHVLKPKLLASDHQLGQFRQLKSNRGRFPGRMCDNNRPLQPLNDRNVYSVANTN